MNIQRWLELIQEDATRRGLPQLRDIAGIVTRGAGVLRNADWNPDASGKGSESEDGKGKGKR